MKIERRFKAVWMGSLLLLVSGLGFGMCGCAGTALSITDAEMGNGEQMKGLWGDVSLYPKVSESMMKKWTPDQITAYIEACAKAMDSLSRIDIHFELEQHLGAQSDAEGAVEAAISATVDALKPE